MDDTAERIHRVSGGPLSVFTSCQQELVCRAILAGAIMSTTGGVYFLGCRFDTGSIEESVSSIVTETRRVFTYARYLRAAMPQHLITRAADMMISIFPGYAAWTGQDLFAAQDQYWGKQECGMGYARIRGRAGARNVYFTYHSWVVTTVDVVRNRARDGVSVFGLKSCPAQYTNCFSLRTPTEF